MLELPDVAPFTVPMGTKVTVCGINATIVDTYVYGLVDGSPTNLQWIEVRLRKYRCKDEHGQDRYYDEGVIEKAIKNPPVAD